MLTRLNVAEAIQPLQNIQTCMIHQITKISKSLAWDSSLEGDPLLMITSLWFCKIFLSDDHYVKVDYKGNTCGMRLAEIERTTACETFR